MQSELAWTKNLDTDPGTRLEPVATLIISVTILRANETQLKVLAGNIVFNNCNLANFLTGHPEQFIP